MTTPQLWEYRLEQLYVDQEPGFVMETIPHVLIWLDPKLKGGAHRFKLRESTQAGNIEHELQVSWNIAALAQQDTRLVADLARFQQGNTLMKEDRAKYAAYGLAMVAISCFLKRRVVDISYYRLPDLLLDPTPSALQGVEVAGRSTGGFSKLTEVAEGSSGKNATIGKRAQLMAKQDVVEGYLSIWCCRPKLSLWAMVKP